MHLKELLALQKKKGIIPTEYYKNYKRIYNQVIRQAKKMYFDNIIKNSASKSKTIWKIINSSIKNNLNQNSNEAVEIEVNNQLTTDKPKISNKFNSYLINLPKSYDAVQSNIIQTPVLPNNENSIYLQPITISEMVETINSLKDSNSLGPDDISTKIIKLCAHQIAEPLTHIINHCFKEGTFPSLLKLSKVIPLYKKVTAKKFVIIDR